MQALDLVARWPVEVAAVGVIGLVAPAPTSADAGTSSPASPGTGPTAPSSTGAPAPSSTGAPAPSSTGSPAAKGTELLAAVGPVDRVFPWASVTKPVTALAVLVAVEERILDLDDPAGPPGATVRHLLAHASGLGPEGQTALTRPGVRRIYSNAGFEVLADLVAARSGMPFRAYLDEGVLAPLGMDGTALAPTGSPASGLAGPWRDLAALAAELLVPTLVSEATLLEARSVAFPGLAGVLPGFGRFDPCDWGLGLEVRGAKHPHWTGRGNSLQTFGHFGQSGSFLWVDPVAGLACAGLASRPFGPWAAEAWPVLADAVLQDAGLLKGARRGPAPAAQPGEAGGGRS